MKANELYGNVKLRTLYLGNNTFKDGAELDAALFRLFDVYILETFLYWQPGRKPPVNRLQVYDGYMNPLMYSQIATTGPYCTFYDSEVSGGNVIYSGYRIVASIPLKGNNVSTKLYVID